jgi:hypothetical protein
MLQRWYVWWPLLFKRSYLRPPGFCFKSGNSWQLLGNEFSWYYHNQWRFFSWRFIPMHMRIYFLAGSGYKAAFLQPRCLKNLPITVLCTRRQGSNCHTSTYIYQNVSHCHCTPFRKLCFLLQTNKKTNNHQTVKKYMIQLENQYGSVIFLTFRKFS